MFYLIEYIILSFYFFRLTVELKFLFTVSFIYCIIIVVGFTDFYVYLFVNNILIFLLISSIYVSVQQNEVLSWILNVFPILIAKVLEILLFAYPFIFPNFLVHYLSKVIFNIDQNVFILVYILVVYKTINKQDILNIQHDVLLIFIITTSLLNYIFLY